jgi:hypothetical protein
MSNPLEDFATKLVNLCKREFDQKARDKAAKEGAAMPDGSFPILNAEDLANAVHAIGRANHPEAVKEHIRKRAKDLGLTDWLKQHSSMMGGGSEVPMARA